MSIPITYSTLGYEFKPPPKKCSGTCLQVCRLKRLGGYAGIQEISRCCTRGEFEESIGRRRESTQVRDPPWFWNPGQTSPEVQNRGIIGLTKRTYVLQKYIKYITYSYVT